MKRFTRYQRLPAWIRFFSWVFLIIGTSAALLSAAGAVFNFEGRLILFGIQYAGPLRDWLAVTLGVTFAFLAYAAFALLWGRSEGRKVGLAAGYIGLCICGIAVFSALSEDRIYIPIEPFFQTPFIVVLHRLKARWEEEPNKEPEPTPTVGAAHF
jgi:hypothetical protein